MKEFPRGAGFRHTAVKAAVILMAVAPGWRARADTITDTLTGLTPGDTIGCDYTFQNGDPSIPCAQDTVGADGTVSFIKPNAAFDGVDYFDVTTGTDIIALVDPPEVPLISQVAVGEKFPILENYQASSFFDVFTDITLPGFNNDGLAEPGAINTGDEFNFVNGTSSGLPDVTIPGFTGTAVVVGFDEVGTPEPDALLLFATGLGGLSCWRWHMRQQVRVRAIA